MQFDADTVGSASPAADAEVCMMAADTMEALGIEKGQYRVNVSSRKILDGILEVIGITGETHAVKRLNVLRAMDKYDRLGAEGVRLLLGAGRRDESGDFTRGAELSEADIDTVLSFVGGSGAMRGPAKYNWLDLIGKSDSGAQGIEELLHIEEIILGSGYKDRIVINPSIVRGLEYYTGPVFECELLMETKDEKGNPVRFGSVGGGGRYDDLVARFTGQQVPATGFSIGVSRLYSALEHLKKNKASETLAPVVVTVMDKERQGDYWKLVQTLREAGIRAEMYIGTSNMQKQMKYADKRGAPLVIIQGGDEKAKGEVMIKDLRLGSELAAGIETREEYASQRLAQFSVAEGKMVEVVKKALGL
jgi:histidyl-tRNA synthetase